MGSVARLHRRVVIPVDWFHFVAIGFPVVGVCVKGFPIRRYVYVRIFSCRGEVRDSNCTVDICHLLFVGACGYLA